MESEDLATVASDGVCFVKVILVIVHPVGLEWANSILLYVDDLVIASADPKEIRST